MKIPLTRVLAALVATALVWTGADPSAAGAEPCDASGVFAADSVFDLVVWDLHDRGGTVSGALRYYGWVPDIDVAPSIRQRAVVAGRRRGDVLVLDVADPIRARLVRTIRARLSCYAPTARDRSSASLMFPIQRGRSDGRQSFSRLGDSFVAMIVRDRTKRLRTTLEIDQKPFRARLRRDASLRRRVERERADKQRAMSLMLEEMAQAGPMR
jgi:hypothetical protein